MNMFKKAKENHTLSTPSGMTKRSCDHCGDEYLADNRNLRRGWGSSKSCAAFLREKSKPGYDPSRVALNNFRRHFWNGIPEENHHGVYRGRRTSERYKMYERENDEYTAVDEFGEPVYSGHTWYDDPGDSEYWEGK